MFLEISQKGITYQERLHEKEYKSSENETMDELVLVIYKVSGPIDPQDLLDERLSEEDDKEPFKKAMRRLFEAGYLKEA